MVTVHLLDAVATEVLFNLGWSIEPAGAGVVYVRPHGTPPAAGGRCGPDFLWDLGEAVRQALAATHPDRGGDEDDFKAVSAAREAER